MSVLYRYKNLSTENTEDGEEQENLVNNKKVLSWAKSKGLRRGDLCRFGNDSYRNSGIMIYNGKMFKSLDYEYFDYGCIPEGFYDLPLDFWYNTLPYHGDVIRIIPDKHLLVGILSSIQEFQDNPIKSIKHTSYFLKDDIVLTIDTDCIVSEIDSLREMIDGNYYYIACDGDPQTVTGRNVYFWC